MYLMAYRGALEDHGGHVAVGGQLMDIGSLFPPYGILGTELRSPGLEQEL